LLELNFNPNSQKYGKSLIKSSDHILEAINKLSEGINFMTINKNTNENQRNKNTNEYQRNKNTNENQRNKNNNEYLNMSKNPNNFFQKFNRSNNRNPSFNRNRSFQNRNHFHNQNLRQSNHVFNNGNNNDNKFKFEPRVQCFYCKRFGHKQIDCQLNPNNNKNQSTDNSLEPVEVNAVSEANTASNITFALSASARESMILVNVEIKGKVYKALVDSGCEITIMLKEVAYELKLDIKPYNGPAIKAVNGNTLEYHGEVNVDLSVKNENNMRHSNSIENGETNFSKKVV